MLDSVRLVEDGIDHFEVGYGFKKRVLAITYIDAFCVDFPVPCQMVSRGSHVIWGMDKGSVRGPFSQRLILIPVASIPKY